MRQDHLAVLILGHFSPQSQREHGFAGQDHWHDVVAQFYDTPHIRYDTFFPTYPYVGIADSSREFPNQRSTKPILYPHFIEEPTSVDRYFADAVLANPAGHDILAVVLISYFQSQVCSAWAAATGQSFDGLPAHLSLNVSDNSKQPTDARGLFGGIGQEKARSPRTRKGTRWRVALVRVIRTQGDKGRLFLANNSWERSTSRQSRPHGSTRAPETSGRKHTRNRHRSARRRTTWSIRSPLPSLRAQDGQRITLPPERTLPRAHRITGTRASR